MSDGMSDGYRMEREARDAEARMEKEQDVFDLQLERLMRNRRDDILEYLAKRGEYFRISDFDLKQPFYQNRKKELKQEMESMRDALVINLERLAGRLKEKL